MSTNTKYIKVSDLKQNKLIFPGFLNPVQEKEIERLAFEDDRIGKAIEFCDSKMNNTGFSSNEFANGRSNAFEEIKQYLQSLK